MLVALFSFTGVMAQTGEPAAVLTFPDYNDKGVGSYTAEWTATVDGQVWTINGFNNNQNGWAFIKAGRKNTEHTATITSPALDVAISDFVISVDQTSLVTSAKVDVLNGEEVVSTVDCTNSFTVGDVDVKVEGAAGNSYRFTIVSGSTSSANGTTVITKVALYAADELEEPEDVTAVSEKFWNFSDFEQGDITETTIIDNLKVIASSTKKVTIDPNDKSLDDISFTQRMKLNGTGASDSRTVQIKVVPNSHITVYGMSPSKNTERTMNLDIPTFGTTVATLVNDGTALGKVEYDYTGEEEVFVYLYSASSGFNLYGVKVEPIQSEEEETSITGENWTFDANPEDVITVTTQGYARNVTGDQVAGLQPVTGWTPAEQTESDPGYVGGIFAYGSENLLNNKVAAPTAAPEGSESPSALGLAAVWSGIAQYTQPIDLEAGSYKFTYTVYNGVNTGAVSKNLFGFIGVDGTEFLSSKSTFTVGEWETVDVTFTLEEPTEGVVSVGFIGAGGSGAAPHLFVDNIAVEKIPEVVVAKEALKAAIEAAQKKADSYIVGENIFQYPESEIQPLNDAIAVAQRVYDNESATVEEVKEATETLNAFVETFAPQFNEPVDGQAYTFTNKVAGIDLSLDGGPKIAETGSAIYLVKQEDGTYAFTADNENYMVYTGTGSNTWSMGLSTTAYGWTITALPDGGYNIVGKNGICGPDNTGDGSALYGNKAANYDKGVWNVAEAETEEPVVTLQGDVNADEKVSVVDVTMTVGFALEKATPSAYEKAAADMDEDGEITVADAAAIVNVIMDFDYEAAAGAKAREASDDHIAVNGASVSLENSNAYVAFQMDITVNGEFNGATLTSRAAAHTLAYNQIAENKYRVLVLSNSNEAIAGNSGELINFDVTGDYELSNIRFVDRSANSLFLNIGGETTGIDTVHSLQAEGEGIYTLSGMRVNTLQKGVNIVRKADGTTVKVLVK